jgi:NADH-quinone oxidoreductase subunit L
MTVTFDNVAWWSWLIVALPLAAAALVGLLGPILRGRSHWPSILAVAGSFAVSCVLFWNIPHGAPAANISYYDWIITGSVLAAPVIAARVLVDQLTVVMLLTVTCVSLLVVIYSRSYMRDHHDHPERGYERFFAFMALFVASMCILVLAGNFVVLYLGWEAVGLCSYLLIGFYYPKPSAAEAAKKAFIVNRIGDFGFGLGVLAIYLIFGRLDYQGVFAATQAAFANDLQSVQAVLGLPDLAASAAKIIQIQNWMTPICLLLFAGAVGKSAQIPLYVWLPDAMEGPSPVSALIHAATMVTAGVYMVARCGPLFAHSPLALNVVAVIGGVTAFYSATIAMTQYDMKRILAYSTISQLGYMFLGLGVFAASDAIFHLFTHAFFKALLFLAAGSVMHAMNGVIDIRRLGGLRRIMPITALTFWTGGLALCGFPLLSGFWSKDEIVGAAIMGNAPLGWLAMVTNLLTALYTFRLIFVAFHGPLRTPEEAEHPHESGRWMTVPLILLAIGAAFAGFAGVRLAIGTGFLSLFTTAGGRFQTFLEGPLQPYHHLLVSQPAYRAGPDFPLMYLAGALAIIGILITWYIYVRRPALAAAAARAFGPVYQLSSHKYFIDELYDVLFVGAAWTAGLLLYVFDSYVVDGAVFMAALVPRTLGLVARYGQMGAVQGYALSMAVLSAVVILAVLLAA